MSRTSGIHNVTAVLSMLHEQREMNSATRRFRQSSVLEWTLQRLSQSQGVTSMAVLCWEDQLEAVQPIAAEASAYILAKGPRQHLAGVEAIAAAQRWAGGWRGGLLNTCHFDQGFHAPWVHEVLQSLSADAVVLVDPASALIDPALIDGLIERSASDESLEMIFSPAAPGLCGVLLRPAVLERLSKTGLHPGKLLHYLPDAPTHDPCSGPGCISPPTSVARTTHQFKFNSQRQIERLSIATGSLNGQLIHSAAESLVARADALPQTDSLPREVVLELNLDRQTRAIYRPARDQIPDRSSLPASQFEPMLAELGKLDDTRLTLGGAGDPLLAGHCFDVIEAAHRQGVAAIHLQTDLLGISRDVVDRLVDSQVDIVSVHLPAVSDEMYQRMMGVDALRDVMGNIRRFVEIRRQLQRLTPILVPTFVKCRSNLAEMEPWYDQWLRAIGAAVIAAPGDFAGLIEDQSVTAMSPPTRRACRRITDRVMILCDGRVVSCEEDVVGRQCMGRITEKSIGEIWRESFGALRADHTEGRWADHPACARCHHWHQP